MGRQMSPRQLLEKLVSFPTVSRDSNLDLIDWVEEYLAHFGIVATRVPNPDGTKASLYAHAGPQVAGGVILSGHSDVVPVDGQAWDTDPFVVTEKDGKLYGRGTCDMKGFDALALWALVEAHVHGVNRPLQFALSYDEEIGCTGAPPMIDHMRASGMPIAELVIVGEPSMMKTVTGHKGSAGFRTHVKGFEVHSSLMHTGVSAIMEAARLIDWANQMNVRNQARPPSDNDAIFEPPFTTVHVGTISGGTAHNITAADCHFNLDFRCVPSETPDDWRDAYFARIKEIEQDMQAVHPDTRIEVEQYFHIPGLKPEKGGAAEALVRKLTGDNGTHVVSYGTEAGQFQERGYSAVVCGPGDIAQAHQPNEFLSIAQLDEGAMFMSRLLSHLKE